MSSAKSAKYTPAPTSDPEEHLNTGSYTQAPPSYQAESSAAQDEDRLFGGPRSSEDNLPDDFKVRGRQHLLLICVQG
jgi:protein lifeguard